MSRPIKSETVKIAGKRVELPAGADAEWSFEERAGGLWIATHVQTGERKRVAVRASQSEIAFSVGGKLGLAKRELSARRAGASAAGSDADLVAQFPGKVRKVLVAAGAQVTEGDPLVLVEAMKMEFSIKAPFAGRVAKIHVTEGQQLAPGHRFLDLEPAPKGDKK